jgi:uncharacterized protein with NRDE domain
MLVNKTINNLYAFLMSTNEDEIIVRTSLVSGGWHDNEFDAHAAGFNISRFTNQAIEARRGFAECYRITRR